MPHDRNGKLIRVGSIVKGPNCSGRKGLEMIGIVHTMREGQKCSGDVDVLATFQKLDDGSVIIDKHPSPYVNSSFNADEVTLIE